jgi:hypothetical protein
MNRVKPELHKIENETKLKRGKTILTKQNEVFLD